MAKVVVYSSESCTYCKQAKEFLKDNNIEYTEKNVSTDMEARKELMAKGHMGVPVIYVDDAEMVGFDKPKLKELLGL
ncbi:MAG: glutaredoxin family protein [Peptoniphilaceae bacterium]|uniref:glutaredoxin family protein n=1 Tax=Parvimonas sp. TaxID=1944660 RepID=UPI0025D07C79|nr:glutaredoxin family protein [Parvimonas sp.]MCI5997360.1 glutaredoxin family protein [Parvimonas sp.]MDD7765415.1 glutaredoxin family protein [Peptoniphilaceae bacterium]MDY3050681.1 glutaredoxin family protein [Parvimonas sp.]